MSQPAQQQEVPGIQSEMTPVPDCGEESYRGTGQLEGKVAVITGADSGIGRAVAIAYAREGADVVISYLSEDSDAAEVKEYVERAGRRAVLIPGDISKPDHCRSIIDTAIREFGRLDVLVSNAAYQMSHETLEEITDDEWTYTFETNVGAFFYLTKAALPHLKSGRVDHRQLFGQLRHAVTGPRPVRRHEGRDRQLLRQLGPAARRAGHPGQQRRAGPDLDPAHPGHDARGEGEALRRGHPARPGGATRRTGPGVRPAGLRGRQLHLRCPDRRHRWPAHPVIHPPIVARRVSGRIKG